eukprot:673207-Hanusia_phi.AAC.2
MSEQSPHPRTPLSRSSRCPPPAWWFSSCIPPQLVTIVNTPSACARAQRRAKLLLTRERKGEQRETVHLATSALYMQSAERRISQAGTGTSLLRNEEEEREGRKR